jgi:hypothetical protein
MLALYMDQHVPSAITEGLRERGIDVLTAHEDGHSAADDEIIFAHCTQLGRILFTRDHDFLQLAFAAQADSREFAGIVFAHQLQVTIGDAIRDLELICHAVSADAMRNRVYRLPI